MARMKNAIPARKVITSTLASAVATVVIWALDTYLLDPDMPAAVAGSVLTICTALVGYYTPPSAEDQVVET